MKCVHHDDTDGRSAAAVVAKFTGNRNKRDYIEADYSTKFDFDMFAQGEEVYIVDISFGEENYHILKRLIDKNCKVIWIDHHKTSEELIRSMGDDLDTFLNLRYYVHTGRSGAMLAWEYLSKNDEVPLFIQLISDFDCWNNKMLPDSTFFKLGVESLDTSPLSDTWVDLFNGHSETFNNIMSRGKIVKEYVDIENTFQREQGAYESKISGYRCLVINRDGNSWLFGEEIKKFPVCVLYYFDGDKYNYSVYTDKKDIDCSMIAKKYGGGGHPGASGFTSKELVVPKGK